MVYGYYNKVQRRFNIRSRISSSAIIIDKNKLDIDDNTWIWHYSIIDASNGIKIGKGCQIGAWVGIFTHGSHFAIRLLGDKYIEIPKDDRVGYQRGPVEIGDYTFIGAQSIILPNIHIGKGCIISAMSMVTKSVPDYAIVSGNPAEVIGDTRNIDKKYLNKSEIQNSYYDKSIVDDFLQEKLAKKDNKNEK